MNADARSYYACQSLAVATGDTTTPPPQKAETLNSAVVDPLPFPGPKTMPALPPTPPLLHGVLQPPHVGVGGLFDCLVSVVGKCLSLVKTRGRVRRACSSHLDVPKRFRQLISLAVPLVLLAVMAVLAPVDVFATPRPSVASLASASASSDSTPT